MSGIPAGAGQLLGKRLGKFEILALLALGGTAEIYLARIGGAAGFEKYVVVKCLHDHLADDTEFVKMFLDEARLAAHLDHSNIVQTMELGQHEGRYYMVMEFLAGLSLAMIVRRATERLPSGRIPAPLVLNILAQACAGLHYAHEKAMNGKALNIVHRDISPQNLVISFEGVVKVVDFGIAKAEMRETRTRSGTIKGKFAYMSPEQCVANNVDRRTDVFALGVIAHELLTGRRLFKRPSPYETYQAVLECDIKPPSVAEAGIDPALDPVIMRAITKDKEVRYPTAEAFGDALLGYLHHRGIGSGPGDVSRFFELSFAQEIEEHWGRMRELISGRDISVDTGVNWGSDDDPEDGGLRQAAQANGAHPGPKDRPSIPSFTLMLDDLGTGSRGEDDDEMPAERTRIESNPLERINELERMVAQNAANAANAAGAPAAARPTPAAPPTGTPPGTAPPAAQPTGGPMPPADMPRRGAPGPGAPGGMPLGGPPVGTRGGTPGAPSSGAMPLGGPPSSGVMPLGGPPSSGVMPLGGPSLMVSSGPSGAESPSGMPPSGRFPDLANLPTVIAEHDPAIAAQEAKAISGAHPPASLAGTPPPDLGRTQIAPPGSPGGPPGNGVPGSAAAPVGAVPFTASRPHAPPPSGAIPSSSPQGYPVLSAELSAQIATGATVFPSGPHSGALPVPPSGPHAGRLPDPSEGYSRTPSPRPPDASPGQPRDQNDPQRAASLMSPVGPQYAEPVDWSAAAAAPARAVPPWLLAILFVGALGIALALTIVVAKIIR